MSTRFAVALTVCSLISGGCCYCASPYDDCGPLFGGSYDPYYDDCGSFHRVGSAYSGSHAAGDQGQISPTPADQGAPAQPYYPEQQTPPPAPGPTNGGASLRANFAPQADTQPEETFVEEQDGPILFRQSPRTQQGVAQDRPRS